MRRMNFSRVRQQAARVHRAGQQSLHVEIPFEEAKERCLTYVSARLSSRTGSEAVSLDDLLPKDFS